MLTKPPRRSTLQKPSANVSKPKKVVTFDDQSTSAPKILTKKTVTKQVIKEKKEEHMEGNPLSTGVKETKTKMKIKTEENIAESVGITDVLSSEPLAENIDDEETMEITENDYEDFKILMQSHGYIPQKKLVDDKDNIIYITAINPLGSTVYINPNKLYSNGKSTKNVIKVTKCAPHELIEHGITRNVNDLVGMEMDLAVVECPSGICIINKKNDTELHYNWDHDKNSNDNYTLAVPVLNADELIHDPSTTLYNTDKISSRMVNHYYVECIQTLELFNRSYQTLNQTLKKFYENTDTGIAELKQTTDVLRNFAHGYVIEPPESETQKKHQNEVIKNIVVRDNLTVNIIKECQKLRPYCQLFDKIHNDISSINESMDEKLLTVGKYESIDE